MRPTKRTKAVKKPRKRTVKKAYDGKSPMGKLMKLKYRINDAYNHRQESGLVPDKQEFIMANLMWKKYSNGVESTNEGMWELIDELLTQETPSKIGAIKTYRRFVNSTLKEAKDMVDAREIKIKKGW